MKDDELIEVLRRLLNAQRDQAHSQRDEFEILRDRLDDIRDSVNHRGGSNGIDRAGYEIVKPAPAAITIPFSSIGSFFAKHWPHVIYPLLLAASHFLVRYLHIH